MCKLHLNSVRVTHCALSWDTLGCMMSHSLQHRLSSSVSIWTQHPQEHHQVADVLGREAASTCFALCSSLSTLSLSSASNSSSVYSGTNKIYIYCRIQKGSSSMSSTSTSDKLSIVTISETALIITDSPLCSLQEPLAWADKLALSAGQIDSYQAIVRLMAHNRL